MYTYDYLVQARHDDLMRAAARHRPAAQALRARAPRRRRVTTAPARLLAGVRAHGIRPASS
jgi:hypothetical protein